MIVGAGVDLVEVARIGRLLERWGDAFRERIFTPGERAYCDGYAFPAKHYAARFAAKEAALKALGLGMGMGVGWQDLEVCRDERGKPELRLHGGAATLVEARGVQRLHLSLSHTEGQAIALVVAEGP